MFLNLFLVFLYPEDTRMGKPPSKKFQIYVKSMSTEVFKVFTHRAVFLRGVNELRCFLKNALVLQNKPLFLM